jgi:hypothetical protein
MHRTNGVLERIHDNLLNLSTLIPLTNPQTRSPFKRRRSVRTLNRIQSLLTLFRTVTLIYLHTDEFFGRRSGHLRVTPGARPRAAPSRGRCVGKEECRAPNIFGLDCEGTLAFDFVLLWRLLARGIAMALRCRHKPATAGIRSSARRRRPDRHRSVDRRHYLTAGVPLFFVTYSAVTSSTCFILSYLLS